MKIDEMKFSDVKKKIEIAESEIANILAKLSCEGFIIKGCSFVPFARVMTSDPPGYAPFTPRIFLEWT